MPVTEVLLGLGSNQARQAHLLAALDRLAELLSEMRCSPVFESEAVGYAGDNFYNLVVAGNTHLSLLELNQALKQLEQENGRYASDRTAIPLDIDILTFGEMVGAPHGIKLPRAEILSNAFVLWPLALLVPDTLHPVIKRSYQSLWSEAQIAQRLWPVAFSWGEQALTPTSLVQAYPAC